MIVIQEALARDRFEMTDCIITNANGLHPHNVVLQGKGGAQRFGYILGDPGIGIGAADVEEEGRVVLHHTIEFSPNIGKPLQIGIPRLAVLIRLVCDTNVIGWGCDDDVDRPVTQST
jgi:hypothetical protein